ncbi:MAG TPA: LysM domain-containing protein [Patescibacteria group bacterium]|nr:LysM domain-containing protein [Patescibacteria group bacterium]
MSLKTEAAANVTPSSGGTNISADKAANATTPAWTTLGNIVITEGANGDFAASQTNTTLILTAPNNWSFNPGVGTVTYTAARDITSSSIAVTATTITITFSTDGTANKSDVMTISGLQVRAIDGSVIPSSGNIYRTSANPGTGAIVGIVNDSTSFGALSQAIGAKNKLIFTNQPSATAIINIGFAVKPVIAVQDQFGHTVTTDNTSTITLTPVLSDQNCGGTLGSGVLFSNPASGTAVTSGVKSYTMMRYSAAESIKICATSGTLVSALSNEVVVSANIAPVATIPSFISQPTDGTGYVNIQTNISDANLQNTKLKVEYSPDGGMNWYAPYLAFATPSSGAIDLNNSNAYQIGTSNPIDTSGGAVTLNIVWDTKNASNGGGSLDGLDQSNYQIRVTPSDSLVDGSVQTSASFRVDNLSPVLSFVDDVAAGPIQSDTIIGSWGDSTTKKWDYFATNTCSITDTFTKLDTDSMNQSDETNNGRYICLYGEDGFGNKSILVSTNSISIDATPPALSFTNDIAAGPVSSDTITGDWDAAVVKKWDYFATNTCSITDTFTKLDTDSMNQSDETNNGFYICLYGEDSLGNKSVLASANKINIDATAPALSFANDVEIGPVASDTITGDWDAAVVKKWDYFATNTCSITDTFTKLDTDSMNQSDETNNGFYICIYSEDALANKSVLSSANPINIDSTSPNTIIDSNPALVTYSTDATFTFSSSEASTFECRVDGALFAVCTSPVNYSGLSLGVHSFEVKATDLVGNVDLTPANYSWTIETAPQPPSVYTFIPPTSEPIPEPISEAIPTPEESTPTPIPEPTPTPIPEPTPESIVNPIQEIVYGFYVVQPGDSLYSIAAQLGTTREILVALNSEQFSTLVTIPNIIYSGWVFKYQLSTQGAGENIYIVKGGDSLSSIAFVLYGVENMWVDLVELNKYNYPSLQINPDIIIAGWQLKY